MEGAIEQGDHVWWGVGQIHWVVVSISGDGTATLKSGMSGRRKFRVPVKELRLHTKAKDA